MIVDKGIAIKNIFYMLSYAYQVLKQSNYKKIETESFEHIHDLFAAILSKAMAQQIKQGLHKEYIPRTENLSTLRGKLDINGSIRNRISSVQRLSCDYDELTENNIFNQIIKTTAVYLIRHPDVKKENRSALRNTLAGFENVDEIDPHLIRWNTITYHRNNQSYRMMLNLCYFVLNSYLLSTTEGTVRMQQFTDEHMSALYEKFILQYYVKHHPDLHPKASMVEWDIRESISEEAMDFLPRMKTDITLEMGGQTLIIDAKYYKNIWQKYDREDPESARTIRNAHLNQIMNYVRNTDKTNTGKVGGMLLYAQTGTRMYNLDYPNINGYHYTVRTLDLNQEFSEIALQLDDIAKVFRS